MAQCTFAPLEETTADCVPDPADREIDEAFPHVSSTMYLSLSAKASPRIASSTHD
jgi:hypothetical protein